MYLNKKIKKIKLKGKSRQITGVKCHFWNRSRAEFRLTTINTNPPFSSTSRTYRSPGLARLFMAIFSKQPSLVKRHNWLQLLSLKFILFSMTFPFFIVSNTNSCSSVKPFPIFLKILRK